jgi:hypothetical protein
MSTRTVVRNRRLAVHGALCRTYCPKITGVSESAHVRATGSKRSRSPITSLCQKPPPEDREDDREASTNAARAVYPRLDEAILELASQRGRTQVGHNTTKNGSRRNVPTPNRIKAQTIREGNVRSSLAEWLIESSEDDVAADVCDEEKERRQDEEEGDNSKR